MKALLSVIVLSVVVLAGVVHDLKMGSTDFMTSPKVETLQVRLDDQLQRTVASESQQRPRPAAQFVAYNRENQKMINKRWQVLRIFKLEGETLYDFERFEDDNLEIIVDVELVGVSMVWLDGDAGLEYDISYVHSSAQSMAIFREYQDSYEVMELRLVNEKDKEQAEQVGEEKNEKHQLSEQRHPPRGLEINDYYDLAVLSGLDTSVRPEVLESRELIDGRLQLIEGEIEFLELTVHRGTADEKRLDLQYVKIEDGGVFNAGETSGVILNNGEETFQIRFATGPMAQVQVIFTSYRKLDEARDQRYQRDDYAYDDYDRDYPEYDHEHYQFYIEESEARPSSEKGYLMPDDLKKMRDFDSVEAREEYVQEAGFGFSSVVSSESHRAPASL